MSLETSIQKLTDAVNANTQAILGNVSAAGTESTQDTPTAAPPPAAAIPPAPPAAPAPVQPAVAQAIQPAAVQTAAASPSNPAPAAVTFEQLQQEVTAVYQAKNGDPRIMEAVVAHAGAVDGRPAVLSDVPPEQYANLINAVRAL